MNKTDQRIEIFNKYIEQQKKLLMLSKEDVLKEYPNATDKEIKEIQEFTHMMTTMLFDEYNKDSN